MQHGGESLAVQIQSSPAYEVIDWLGEVEVRRYRPALLAEVSLASPSQESVAMAVDCFARYLYGDEVPDDCPVFSQPAPMPHQLGRGDWRLRFFIASNVSSEDAPTPHTHALRLVNEPERLVAAVRHDEKASGRMVHAARRKLQETIRATRRYELDERSAWAAYDAPYVLPLGQRAETLVELRAARGEADAIWEMMTNSARRPRIPSAA